MPSPIALIASLLALSVEGDPSYVRSSIVAVRSHGPANELWIVRPDGADLHRLGATATALSRPSWTLDAKSVLFTERGDAQASLYSLPVDGGTKTLLCRERGSNSDARLAPDGSAIALTLTRDGNSEVYLLARGRLSRLTKSWELDASPAWSPSSDRLAFVSTRLGSAEIFVMDRDGKSVEALTGLGLRAQHPDWSPINDQIVFSVRESSTRASVWSVDARTRNLVRLTNESGIDTDPSFSPDGRWIVFVSDRSGARDLWIMSAEGGDAHPITSGGDFSTPAWSPLWRDSLAGVR